MFDNYNAVNCDNSGAAPVHPPLDLSLPVMQSVDVRTQRLQALANAVRSRRASLGLNQGDLGSRGGPSIVTVGKIERGEITKPEASTLRRLDTALLWAPGSAAGVLDGKAPQELRGDAPGSAIIDAILRDPSLLPEARDHLINQLGLLLRVAPVQETLGVEDRHLAVAPTPEQAAETAAMDARIDSRKRPKETPGTPRKITPAKRPK